MFQPILLKPALFCVVLAFTATPVGSAEEEAAPAEASEVESTEPVEDVVLPPTTAPSLGLDSLLRPRGVNSGVRGEISRKPGSIRGGQDRESWEREFANARAEEQSLEKQVDDLQGQIRETAQGNWNYSPTGGAAPTDPEVLRLRAQLKRDKRSLEAATTRLRDLEVEASLANVPDSWTEPAP